MDRRCFIKGCLCCSMLPLMTSCSKQPPLTGDEFDEEYTLSHVEIHLVENCNLNCKYCSHFASIAEKEMYNVADFKKDVARLSEVTEGKINEIQLLGGEPLLHPNIAELSEYTRQMFPQIDIYIITNGLLLTSMSDDFWKTVAQNNILLTPSLYPIKLDWKTIFEKSRKFGVKLFNDFTRSELKFEDIEKYRFDKFYKLMLDTEGKQKIDRHCYAREDCANLIHGKLYPCFVASNIRHFNKKFKKNLKITKEDYIDIYKAKNLKEIKNFLRTPTPFCRYCGDFYHDLPWETSDNHPIEEWIMVDNLT